MTMIENKQLADYEYNTIPNEKCTLEKEELPPKYGLGVRHVQLLIFLLCLTVNIIGRGHLGVTIVAMTSSAQENTLETKVDIIKINATNHLREDGNAISKKDNIVVNNSYIETAILRNVTVDNHVTYNWPKSVQEMVLNAFFLGYAIMMFPMGMICQRFGGKLPLQIALFINAIVSIATPSLTVWGGWKAVCCCRILQGLAQAGTYPCIQTLLAKWLPANERASLGSCVYSGLTVGTVIGFQMAGFLGASRWGWPSTFYVIGVITFVCFILLSFFGAATPLANKFISKEERKYIMSAVRDRKMKLKTPWRAIFTSRPLWGTITTQVGCAIGFVFFFNQVPSYIHHILGVNFRDSGVLSSLPYLASIVTTLGFGWMSDYCTNNNIVSATNARRICNSFASFGLAIPLVLTSYTNNTSVAVACLVVGMGGNMAAHSGWMVNHIDLAPNFSGTLTATGNTVANIFVILTPIVVSNVVTDMEDLMQWRIMFFIIAAITIAANMVFLFLVSTEIQPWNYAPENETCTEDPSEHIKTIDHKS